QEDHPLRQSGQGRLLPEVRLQADANGDGHFPGSGAGDPRGPGGGLTVARFGPAASQPIHCGRGDMLRGRNILIAAFATAVAVMPARNGAGEENREGGSAPTAGKLWAQILPPYTFNAGIFYGGGGTVPGAFEFKTPPADEQAEILKRTAELFDR